MADRLTDEQIAALRAAEKAARATPWSSDESREFLILVRNTMPALLDELEGLRKEKARLIGEFKALYESDSINDMAERVIQIHKNLEREGNV